MLLTNTDSLIYNIEAGKKYEDSCKVKRYLTSVATQKIQNITIMQIT